MLEVKKAAPQKRYMDDIPAIDMFKYNVRGLVAIIGNGHLYGFVLPEHVEQAEAMRVAYDAALETEG